MTGKESLPVCGVNESVNCDKLLSHYKKNEVNN